MNLLRAVVLSVVYFGCAEVPVPTLDATTADRADADADAAREATVVDRRAVEPPRWSDAPVCDPPEDVAGYREPDRRHCPPLWFDPGPADPDAGMMACVPGRAEPCTCADGRPGVRSCDFAGRSWGCSCGIIDAGVLWERQAQAPVPLPPRLVRPLSGMRVSSRRPALCWVLPTGVTQARVELCADRPCTRVLQRAEVSGTTWRPTTRLPPGVVFWRVMGLGANAAVVWTSATWEFGVGRCDAEVDTSLRTLRDFDGDGYDDAPFGFMVSVVGVLWGRPTNVAPTILNIGGAAKDLGEPLATQGDINGDGLADLALSFGPYVRTTTTTSDLPFSNHRHVWGVYYGDRTCGLRAEPARAGDLSGPTICDVNGDGYGDVAIVRREGVAIFLGGATGLAGAPAVDLRFTDVQWMTVLRCGGDVDGDGYADLVATDDLESGGAGVGAVLYGAPDARIDRRAQRISSVRGGHFGQSARIADLNGDGYSEVLIGSYSVFWVYRGTPAGVEVFLEGTQPNGYQGDLTCPGGETPLLRTGDFDGDGRNDVASNYCASAFFFLSNGTTMTSTWPRWVHRTTLGGRERIGDSYVPGDVNGDGWDDLLTSMWTNTQRGPYSLNLHYLRGRELETPAYSWDIGLAPQFDNR